MALVFRSWHFLVGCSAECEDAMVGSTCAFGGTVDATEEEAEAIDRGGGGTSGTTIGPSPPSSFSSSGSSKRVGGTSCAASPFPTERWWVARDGVGEWKDENGKKECSSMDATGETNSVFSKASNVRVRSLAHQDEVEAPSSGKKALMEVYVGAAVGREGKGGGGGGGGGGTVGGEVVAGSAKACGTTRGVTVSWGGLWRVVGLVADTACTVGREARTVARGEEDEETEVVSHSHSLSSSSIFPWWGFPFPCCNGIPLAGRGGRAGEAEVYDGEREKEDGSRRFRARIDDEDGTRAIKQEGS